MLFTKLRVWHAAIQLADDIYELTSRFPADERYKLVHQLRKAATSVHSNIAEGNLKDSPAENAHFINISETSLSEIQSQLKFCKRRGLEARDCELALRKTMIIAKMLVSLKKEVLKQSRRP